MLLGFFTIVIMLAIAYAHLREGVFTGFIMCCNVLLAGLIAFNFWEPLANLLDPMLWGYEDMLVLMLLFCLSLGLLRTATNALSRTHMHVPQLVQRGGGAFFGLITGYLTCGFFLCALHTLPWHEHFMSLNYEYQAGQENALRKLMPPDRIWLATMQRASKIAFASGETFDREGTFSLRYARYRRYNDSRDPIPYTGEFDKELRAQP